MSDIFLSYASKDRNRILPLVTVLESEGWSVFWDRATATGQAWHDVLGRGLEVCSCTVVAWSQYSVRSRWIYEVAETCQKKGALFPVMLDSGIDPPLGFRALQTADLSLWDGGRNYPAFMQLAGDLAAHLGKAGGSGHVSPPDPFGLTLVGQPSPQAPQPTANTEPALLDDAILQKARQHLAHHLGPIAGLLVRKAARQASNEGQLVQLLAAELENEQQRTDFVRRMKS